MKLHLISVDKLLIKNILWAKFLHQTCGLAKNSEVRKEFLTDIFIQDQAP